MARTIYNIKYNGDVNGTHSRICNIMATNGFVQTQVNNEIV